MLACYSCRLSIFIIMEENIIMIRDPQTFCFILIGQKYVDENLKHEIEFIIKSNESLAENKIKKRDCTIILEI